MEQRHRPGRRQFFRYAGAAGAVLAFDALIPAWARNTAVTRSEPADGQSALVFDLGIREQAFDIAGDRGNAMTINDGVPGPLLEWYEGRDVVLNVTNHMRHSTSIHWHGILLPFEMDGVPGVTFRGIEPGATFQYRFPVKQSGTYWYHSHTGLQEQSGVYGPLVIHPSSADPIHYDRDYVVMLSDWTFEDPHKVMAKLKKMSDYYNYQQFTLAEQYGTGGMSAKEAWSTKLAWDRMRMMPTDIADITGATYTYLMNGLHPAGNWTGLFEPGDRVRLRFINGAAMSYFNVRIPGLPMTVVAADGQNVKPVETDEFQIGVAETYDVIVEPGADDAYTVMAESMDRSGFAAGTLAARPGLRAPIPPLRERPLLTMVDMGMDMDGMDHSAMGSMHDPGGGGQDSSHDMAHGEHPSGGSAAGMDMSGRTSMDMVGMDHSTMGAMHDPGGAAQDSSHDMAHGEHRSGGSGAGMTMTSTIGPIVARHGPDTHGPGNIGVAEVQRNRLGERGIGLAEVEHRVLVYNDLKRLHDDYDDRPPAREIELHLTGHMERYMWSFDGKQFHEVDGPIEFHYGERLRLTMVNDTMMNHPIHLHGMWMELDNGHGREIPRKHTINLMPASRVSALITADAPGRWAFHCHLLYHMEMGMFRVVRVS